MHNARGMTLIELLVTLAVIAMVVTAGAPAMRKLTESSDLSAHVALYAQALHTARAMAVSGGRGVTLCPLDTTQHCNGDWNQDLTLFYDDARQGTLKQNADAILIVAVPGHDQRMNVRWQGFGEKRFLNVRASGAYRQNGRFIFCPKTGAGTPAAQGKSVVINVTGRTRVENADCP